MRELRGRWSETMLVAALLAAIITVPLITPEYRILLTRSLQFDELATWLLARDLPGPALWAKLQDGADFNPPLLYVIDSLLLFLLPFLPTQVVLRLVSLVSAWAAAMLLYRLCRHSLGMLPSLVAGMTLFSHATFERQLFEARFYMLWLALSLSVAWSVHACTTRPDDRSARVQLAICSAATCVVHYFGIITLACMAAAVLVHAGRNRGERLVARWMAAGPLALALVLPLYVGQRAVLGNVTWVPLPVPSRSFEFVAHYWATLPFLLVFLASLLIPGRRTREREATTTSIGAGMAAALGLLVLPAVLVAFSYLVQPVEINRYALPALAGMACLVAMASQRLSKPLQVAVLAMMITAYVHKLAGHRMEVVAVQERLAVDVAQTNAVAESGREVVSFTAIDFLPTYYSRARINKRFSFVVVPPPGEYAGLHGWRDMNKVHGVGRTVLLRFSDLYGTRVVELERLRGGGSFYAIGDEENARRAERYLPEFHACRASTRRYLFTRLAAVELRPRGRIEVPACADGS